MVGPDSCKVSRAPHYSGAYRQTMQFRLRGYHPLWRAFPGASAITLFSDWLQVVANPPVSPSTPIAHRCNAVACDWFRLFPFRSPLLRESLRFLLLRLMRCFSSAACLYPHYRFMRESQDMTPEGLPHSDISGSKPARGSPKRFVACYVLHRLQVPRHPPCALYYLTTH